MTRIVRWRQAEQGTIDSAVLMRLEASLGPERCREVLSQACCEIIEKLTRFEIAENPHEAHRLARNIAALSDEIGMSELGGAARNASDCALRGDPAARSATAARMVRLGEASLDTLLSRQSAG